MHQFLIDNFQISTKEAEIFATAFAIQEYSKGVTFIRDGEVCHKIGFVKKGLLKCISIGNNKTVIDDFAFENQFVTNYISFLTGDKSSKRISCINDSTLLVIDRKTLVELGAKHPFIEQIARKVTEKLYFSMQQKLDDLRLLSARERYLKLVRTNKKVLLEVPQYEIASYLNVSAETVSRIRKQLAGLS